jgi:hypothetical protein
MDTESELRPKQPLMLKEWLELESSAELSRDGFGCYPRHLAAEFWNAGGRRRNGDVIFRVSTAVRAALLRTTSVIDGEAGALTRSFSKRLRVGLWKKQRGEREEMDRRRVPSCSATVASGRRDDSSSPAMSPRRVSWEGRRTSTVDGGVALGSRRSQEAEAVRNDHSFFLFLFEQREMPLLSLASDRNTCLMVNSRFLWLTNKGKNVAGSKCETARRLDVDREQEQRLSPVSVMDFPGPNEEDDNNEIDGSNGHGEDDVAMSPTFARSMKNTRSKFCLFFSWLHFEVNSSWLGCFCFVSAALFRVHAYFLSFYFRHWPKLESITYKRWLKYYLHAKYKTVSDEPELEEA